MNMKNKNNKKWVSQEDQFSFGETPNIYEKLPAGIYELQHNPKTGFYLKKVADDFTLPDKIYGVENDLIHRMLKTFKSINKNFGALFQGLKGTGKTIVAKQVCNELKIPVILVNSAFNDMGTFINSIEQDIVMFFDEFEKVYEFYSYAENDGENEIENNPGAKKNVSNLLTLMDGVFTSSYKRLFLLTTNKSDLPDAMLSRPSRIRYIKEFTDLPFESIMEILSDSVDNKLLIPGLVKILMKLDIITIDIVKSVAEEANIYNTDDPGFFSIFNIKSKNIYYDVYISNDEDSVDGKQEMIDEKLRMPFEQYRKNSSLYINDSHFVIKEVNADMKYFKVKKITNEKDNKKIYKLSFKVHSRIHPSMMEMVL